MLLVHFVLIEDHLYILLILLHFLLPLIILFLDLLIKGLLDLNISLPRCHLLILLTLLLSLIFFQSILNEPLLLLFLGSIALLEHSVRHFAHSILDLVLSGSPLICSLLGQFILFSLIFSNQLIGPLFLCKLFSDPFLLFNLIFSNDSPSLLPFSLLLIDFVLFFLLDRLLKLFDLR